MHRFLCAFLIAALLTACHDAGQPNHAAAVDPPAPEPAQADAQQARMQQMIDAMLKQLADAQAIGIHPPGGYTVIPPLTVDPIYTLPDEATLQLEEALRKAIEQFQASPDADPSETSDSP